MYFAGLNLNPHLSHMQGLEAVAWVATTGGFAYQLYKTSGTSKTAIVKSGQLKANKISTVAKVATATHGAAFFVPIVGYIFATAYNGFEQPEWLSDYPLPLELSIRDNSMVRTFAAVAFIGFSKLSGVCLGHLSSQWVVICVSYLLFARNDITHALFQLREHPRIVETGPYKYVRHPLYR